MCICTNVTRACSKLAGSVIHYQNNTEPPTSIISFAEEVNFTKREIKRLIIQHLLSKKY